MEYVILLIVIVGAFGIMSQYIQNGLQGQFRKAGSIWAYGREHDPLQTRECLWDNRVQVWYSEKCFDYYSRKDSYAADDPTQAIYCRANLSPTSCRNKKYAETCPTSCKFSTLKQDTCHAPCETLAKP